MLLLRNSSRFRLRVTIFCHGSVPTCSVLVALLSRWCVRTGFAYINSMLQRNLPVQMTLRVASRRSSYVKIF
jgi:hypothetical protein